MTRHRTVATVGSVVGAIALGLALGPALGPAGAQGADADRAVSTPRADPVYPAVGSPVLDALHYDLALDWRRTQRRLIGEATITFRAARTASQVTLDLSDALEVSGVTLDGEPVASSHSDGDLVVDAAVVRNERHVLVVDYAGTPEPLPAPATRSDVSTVGWHSTRDGRVWTMQEPYGASTWYPVDDQPSDKASYTFEITAPAGWQGVANGRLIDTTTDPATGRPTTTWRLDSPMSSYLATVSIGRFRHARVAAGHGRHIDLWVPRDRADRFIHRLGSAGAGLQWLEGKLGRYPFDSLGILVNDSGTGMETQTMVTLDASPGPTSPSTVVHEFAHQWYGDLVTPSTWRDVWMNEGMATYLQAVWDAGHSQQPLRYAVSVWKDYDAELREKYGAPAAYDPASFASANVYYPPALMWHTLRRKLGDRLFWRLVRAWPRSHAYGNAGYDAITGWWSRESGRDLDSFFHRWLLSTRSPVGS